MAIQIISLYFAQSPTGDRTETYMKLVEKTFTRGGCYSFLITLALLIISTIMGFDEYGNYAIIINFKLFLICAAAGYATAIVGLIFETKLDPIFKRLIHFVVLLGGFTAIFATAGTGGQSIARKIIISILIFSVAYVIIFLSVFGIKKLILFIEKKHELKKPQAPKQPTEKYTPRYK